MRGPVLVVIVLIIVSEIFVCGAGALKCFLMRYLRETKDAMVDALGILALGIVLDRVFGLIGMQYRVQPDEVARNLDRLKQDISFGKIPEAILAVGDLENSLKVSGAYIGWTVAGRLSSAICAVVAIWFLFFIGLDVRKRWRIKPSSAEQPERQ